MNYNEHIIRGVLRRRPEVSITTARQVGMERATDPELLACAAQHDLIVVTHDIRTMPTHFAAFVMNLSEGGSPGIWYTPQSLSVGLAINAILETWLYSEHAEFRNRELRLP